MYPFATVRHFLRLQTQRLCYFFFFFVYSGFLAFTLHQEQQQ